ncbi:MAG: nuclear transport factor 2 family protein [Solirubrobacterales bacterium]
MSRQNVDFVTGLYSAGESMEKEQLLAALPELIAQACDPEIEWVEDPQRADSRTFRGHEGVLRSFEQWLEQFSEYGFEAERFVDCGDDVLVVAREEGRGSVSGAPVSSLIYQVVTVKDDNVSRFQEFYEEASALKAVGLTELPA